MVLGERDHRDTTQYEFVRTILHEPRFAACVRYVYTEVGAVNYGGQADSLVCCNHGNNDEFYHDFLQLCRNENFPLIWGKTNRYMLLRDIYNVNRRLPDSMKIHLGQTDMPLSWRKIRTSAQFRAYEALYNSGIRDSVMAANFINLYQNQKPINGKRKALLITNMPHALHGTAGRREGYFLKKHFGEKLRTILFNWYDYTNEDGDAHTSFLFADGKWDAAFEKHGCRPVAIPLRNTLFGSVRIPVGMGCGGETFGDNVDGIIFYKPFYAFRCTIGAHGVLDDDYKDEYCRRAALCFGKSEAKMRRTYLAAQRYYNTVRTFQDVPAHAADELRRALDEGSGE